MSSASSCPYRTTYRVLGPRRMELGVWKDTLIAESETVEATPEEIVGLLRTGAGRGCRIFSQESER